MFEENTCWLTCICLCHAHDSLSNTAPCQSYRKKFLPALKIIIGIVTTSYQLC